MHTFGLVGWSGSGKTTLLIKLLPELIKRGIKVSTMKHTHHRVDIDRPGKDSFVHREAGAEEVLLVSSTRWALMHELRDQDEPPIDELIAKMTPVDLLLIEGFKHHGHPKIEVHRPDVGKPPLAPDDPSIVAVATDKPLPNVKVPLLDLNDPGALAEYIMKYCGLKGA